MRVCLYMKLEQLTFPISPTRCIKLPNALNLLGALNLTNPPCLLKNAKRDEEAREASVPYPSYPVRPPPLIKPVIRDERIVGDTEQQRVRARVGHEAHQRAKALGAAAAERSSN
eukprot:2569907-Pleurochrysis_carterae.AAC.2